MQIYLNGRTSGYSEGLRLSIAIVYSLFEREAIVSGMGGDGVKLYSPQ